MAIIAGTRVDLELIRVSNRIGVNPPLTSLSTPSVGASLAVYWPIELGLQWDADWQLCCQLNHFRIVPVIPGRMIAEPLHD